MAKLTVAFRNFANSSKICYDICSVCCNYTCLKNFIKPRLQLIKKNCSIILVLCFNKGFLIKFGQLYSKQSFATWSKYFTQLHYAHSHVTSCGPKRILYLLVVDENGYDLFPHESRGLTVDEKVYALFGGTPRFLFNGYERIFLSA